MLFMCAAGRSEEIAADGIVKGHACSLISAKDVTIPLVLCRRAGGLKSDDAHDLFTKTFFNPAFLQTSMTLERRSKAAVVLTRAAEKGRVGVVWPPKWPCESKHMPASQLCVQAR